MATPHAPAREPHGNGSLFVRVGGPDGLRAAVTVFYDRILADPELAGYFDGTDMTRLRSHQRWFLAAALGGPDVFTGRDLSAAHTRLGVTDDAFDRVVAHLTTTLTDLGVAPADVAEVGAAVEHLRAVVVSVAGMPRGTTEDVGT